MMSTVKHAGRTRATSRAKLKDDHVTRWQRM